MFVISVMSVKWSKNACQLSSSRCYCLLSEKTCQGAFLCMAMANPTVGRNSLHIDCDRSASVCYRLRNGIITCWYAHLSLLHLSFFNLHRILYQIQLTTFRLQHLSHVKPKTYHNHNQTLIDNETSIRNTALPPYLPISPHNTPNCYDQHNVRMHRNNSHLIKPNSRI